MSRPKKNRKNHPTPANLREQILADFTTLRVPVTADQLDEALKQAQDAGWSHLEFLHRLLADQAGLRRQRRIERLIKDARFTEDEVIIYGPQVEEIARHRLFARTVTGQRSEQKAHRPAEDPRQRHAQLQDRFLELGADARRFLDGLVRTQRYSKDHAHKVLALLGTYARADLIAALKRAVRYGAYSFSAVERILAVQANPKTIFESLAEQEREHLQPLLDDNPIGPRPTADYQPLIDKETPDDGPLNPPDDSRPA